MKTIELTRGKVALVDDEDFDRVNQFKWHARPSRGRWYAGRVVGYPGPRRLITMHRFILDFPSEVAHRDGDGLNNTRENLRDCSHACNMQGVQKKKAGATSRFRGVSRTPNGKWLAQIQTDRKSFHLGLFNCEEDAARAYDTKARELFGEWASPNFPICDS